MSKLNNYELIDFTGGNLSGWRIHEDTPNTFLATENGNDFLVSKNDYAYNGMDFEKNVPNIEVGAYYAFSMDMRTYQFTSEHSEIMGVQIIVGNGFPGLHVAMHIAVPTSETLPGAWKHVEGHLFKRRETQHDLMIINCYSFYQLDVDNIKLSLTPLKSPHLLTAAKLNGEPYFKR